MNNHWLPVEQMTYEQAFLELETILQALEAGELSLDDSLAHFERGRALSQYCAALLDKAELRIRQINGDDLSNFIPVE
jgi:exodeoxyribonuclease VII small subunit